MVMQRESRVPFDSDAAARKDLAVISESSSADALADSDRDDYRAGYMQAAHYLAHRIWQLEDLARISARDAHLFIGQIRIVEGDDAL